MWTLFEQRKTQELNIFYNNSIYMQSLHNKTDIYYEFIDLIWNVLLNWN